MAKKKPASPKPAKKTAKKTAKPTAKPKKAAATPKAKAETVAQTVAIPEPPPVRVEGPSLRRVRKAYELYAPMLRGVKGVKRVSYGAKWSETAGGYGFEASAHAADPTVRYAILVYVESKPDSPMDPQADGFIPPQIGGIPTDVIEEKEPVKATANGRVVLSRQGVPVSAGALGVVARKVPPAGTPAGTPDVFVGLTNAHVACGATVVAADGDLVSVTDDNHQPLPTTGGRVASGFDGGRQVDAAAIPLDASVVIERKLFGKIRPFNPPLFRVRGRNAVDVEDVMMTSRLLNDGVLVGRVVMFGHQAFVKMGEDANGTPVQRKLTGLLRILRTPPGSGPFGQAGDSGTIVVAPFGAGMVAVGLYVGTEDDNPAFGLALPLIFKSSDGTDDQDAVFTRMEIAF